MKREIFHRYCAWLFPLLEEFDRQTDLDDRSAQEKRVDGYLAERLLGIYYTRHKDRLNTMELPRVQFCTGKEYVRKKLVNFLLRPALLPPGSRRRQFVKRMAKRR